MSWFRGKVNHYIIYPCTYCFRGWQIYIIPFKIKSISTLFYILFEGVDRCVPCFYIICTLSWRWGETRENCSKSDRFCHVGQPLPFAGIITSIIMAAISFFVIGMLRLLWSCSVGSSIMITMIIGVANSLVRFWIESRQEWRELSGIGF